ncbi:MAG: hypothetical protein ACI80V_002104 [Rhodothermales bacterium]|jgi:hypothetical protein
MRVTNSIQRALGLALFIGLVGTTAVSAQSTYETKSQDWWDGLQEQLSESVSSDIAQVRQDAVRQVIFFAENYDNFVNFDDAAYEIMGRFETSEDIGERLMALAALNAIGEDGTLGRLARVASAEKSDRVRAVTAAVLSAHAASL